MDATILIGTFGSIDWANAGAAKAQYLRVKFPHIPVLHLHGDALHTTRNALAERAKTEWLCFVDADDDLSYDYFVNMDRFSDKGDLLAPMVLWLDGDMPSVPVSLASRDMEVSNQCVIGTMIRKQMFFDVGGFEDWRAWEDWALFLTAYRQGAKIFHNPLSLYIAHVNPNSRNNTIENPKQLWKEIKEHAGRKSEVETE